MLGRDRAANGRRNGKRRQDDYAALQRLEAVFRSLLLPASREHVKETCTKNEAALASILLMPPLSSGP